MKCSVIIKKIQYCFILEHVDIVVKKLTPYINELTDEEKKQVNESIANMREMLKDK